MSLNLRAIIDAVASHALATGYLEQFDRHEAKSAPGTGLHGSTWAAVIGPADSGLASTSVKLEYTLRIQQNMLAEPQDDIDELIIAVYDALITSLSSDYSLGGLIRNIDLNGRYGAGLSGRMGYIPLDKKLFRALDVLVPMILNDVWEQVA